MLTISLSIWLFNLGFYAGRKSVKLHVYDKVKQEETLLDCVKPTRIKGSSFIFYCKNENSHDSYYDVNCY